MRPGVIHQLQRLRRGAAELAVQRPVGLGAFHDQTQADLGPRRVFGELVQLFLGIGRKMGDPQIMGKGDVGGRLIVLPKVI